MWNSVPSSFSIPAPRKSSVGVPCLLLSLRALDQQRPRVSLAAASTGPAPRGSQCAEAAEAHAASSAALCWSDMERWAGCGRAASLLFILTLLKTDKATYPSQRLYSLQQDNSLSGFLNISFCYPHEYTYLAGSESLFVGLFTPGLTWWMVTG